MTNRDHLRAEVATAIGKVTESSLEELQVLWEDTYEPSLCENNLRIMKQHIQSFYQEIIKEIKLKRDAIQADIDKIYAEASTLRRLLKVEFELTPPEMPLHSLRAYLDESLQNLREQLRRRKNEIEDLLNQQTQLCEELEEEPRELLDDPLPTAEEIQAFREHLGNLKELKQDRITEVLQLRRSIKVSLMSLEISLLTVCDNALVNGHQLLKKSSDVVKLREMKKHFETLCQELKQSIETTRRKLIVVWDYLEVDEEWRDRFDEYTEDCQTTYDKLLEELKQRELEKKQNLKRIIEHVRVEITQWWKSTLKSDLEKSRFSNFKSEYYTEDLLALHEMELETLKHFYVSNEKIFELIEKRKELWERMVALEESARDKNRFNNRGGKLLQEEKERKIISAKLPKIEAQLQELVQEYEDKNGHKFTMYGVSVEQVIAGDWQKMEVNKVKLLSARKLVKSATPHPAPSTSRRLLTPMPPRNALTACTSVNMQKAKTVGAKPLVAGSTMKRKMGRHPEESSAKRSILKELVSPNVFVKPNAVKKTGKQPKKVLATIQSKNEKRRSSGRQKKRLSGKIVSRGSNSKIRVISEGSESDSISYECFQSYLGENSPCRSSVLVKTSAMVDCSKNINPIPKIYVSDDGCEKKTIIDSHPSFSPSPNKKVTS